MPRVYITTEERIRGERQKKIRQNGRTLERIFATVKYKVGYHDIAKQSGISYGTVCKIINNPLSARVEQLLAVSDACGIDLVIAEKTPQYESGS